MDLAGHKVPSEPGDVGLPQLVPGQCDDPPADEIPWGRLNRGLAKNRSASEPLLEALGASREVTGPPTSSARALGLGARNGGERTRAVDAVIDLAHRRLLDGRCLGDQLRALLAADALVGSRVAAGLAAPSAAIRWSRRASWRACSPCSRTSPVDATRTCSSTCSRSSRRTRGAPWRCRRSSRSPRAAVAARCSRRPAGGCRRPRRPVTSREMARSGRGRPCRDPASCLLVSD